MSKRSHGTGSIQQRGENSWRLRYYVGDERHEVTFRGAKKDAKEELVRLIHSGHAGEHIEPARVTVEQWIERWVKLNQRQEGDAENMRHGLVGRRTLERYEELLRCHVMPVLGKRPLQKLTGTEIDDLYVALEAKLAPRTVHHVHTVLESLFRDP